MASTFNVDNTAGTINIALQPGQVNGPGASDQDADITLYGLGATEWGEGINGNLYRLLETFACPDKGELNGGEVEGIPQTETDLGQVGLGINQPIVGQLWYNTTNQLVYVCVNPIANEWRLVGKDIDDEEDPDPEIPSIPENVQLALNGKVSKIGDTMTGKLIINGSTTLDDVLELRSNDGPVITLRTTLSGGTSPVLRFYNPNNDPVVTGGSAQGTWGWTKIANRNGHFLSIERTASDNGNTPAPSDGVAEVLTIYQNGEMIFFGQGSGTHSGDIRLPNATFGLADHVVTKQYVETTISDAISDIVDDTTIEDAVAVAIAEAIALLPPPVSDEKTGDIRATIRISPDPGWVLMNDGTIGSGSSAATNRANADTKDLFELLWNNIDDTWCPVSGGRGGSATADFNANKTIQLPRAFGRVLSNRSVTHVLGKYMGAETHSLTANENGSHTHTSSGRTSVSGTHVHNMENLVDGLNSSGTHTIAWSNPPSGYNRDIDFPDDGVGATGSAHSHSFSFTTNSSGTGAIHNNMQPSLFVQFQMKL